MDGEVVLVVVSVLEGRGFPPLNGQLVVLEGKFNGESLETDPVSHASSPRVNTELAWELTRKTLHQHRLQRTPLKLQCFCVDGRTGKKEVMGYVMLDLRMARTAKPAETAGRWYGLLNSKYQKHKPELHIAVTIETTQLHPAPQRPTSSASTLSDGPSHLSLVLDEQQGYYILGPQGVGSQGVGQTDIFVVSLMLCGVKNLLQAVPLTVTSDARHTYHFYYCLFGNDIHSEPLGSLVSSEFQPERASVRFLTTAQWMGVFLAAQADFKVHFCCDGNVLATADIPLSHLSRMWEFSGEYPLVSPNSQDHSASVSIVLTLVKEPAPPAPGKVPEGQVKMGEAPSVQLGHQVDEEAVVAMETMPGVGLQGEGPDGRADTVALPPVAMGDAAKIRVTGDQLNKSARRNLTRSFEEVAKQTSSSSDSSSSSTCSLSGSEDKHPAEEPAVTEMDPGPLVTKGNLLPSSNQPLGGGIGDHPLLMDQSGNMRPKVQLPPQRLGEERGRDEGVHHFCYAIDIHSVRNLSHQRPLNIWLRYCYPFFGTASYVVFQPALTVGAGQEGTFPESYCAFDFATTTLSLVRHITDTALVVEVCSGDQMVGCAHVVLAQVLTQPKTAIQSPSGGDGANQTRGWGTGLRQSVQCVSRVSAVPSGQAMAELVLQLTLEDFGPPSSQELSKVPDLTATLTTPPKLHPVVGTAPPVTEAVGDPRTGPQYRAALELEVWKEEKEKEFLAELRDREASQLKLLAAEQRRREEEREGQFRKRVEEYSRLEAELKAAILDFRRQQDQLREKESRLDKALREVAAEREQVSSRRQQDVQSVRETCAVQLEVERAKVGELEQQVKRLMGQLADSERRCKVVEAEYSSYREASRAQPESQLQAQISMLQLEKSELERKLSSVARSKLHYKQQWSRALQELAVARQREQSVLKEKLLRQEHEVNELRKTVQLNQDTKGFERELAEIKEATLRLSEQVTTKPHLPPQDGGAAPPTSMSADTGSSEIACDSEITRLIEERDALLQTGVYTADDPTIVKLDREVRAAMQRRGLS